MIMKVSEPFLPPSRGLLPSFLHSLPPLHTQLVRLSCWGEEGGKNAKRNWKRKEGEKKERGRRVGLYYCMLLPRFHALLFCGLEVLYFQLLGKKRRVGLGRAAKGAVEAAAAAATPKSPPPLNLPSSPPPLTFFASCATRCIP